MSEPESPPSPPALALCPLPHQGECVGESCTFWDEEAGQCSGACLGDYTPLESLSPFFTSSACTIPWMDEDGEGDYEMDE
ncbi:MAG: hypothetical protein FJ128_09255 [Deltaproteobacteria bacterium]|nr:hypothetical protein [Deltaproteobacteria bacterium]